MVCCGMLCVDFDCMCLLFHCVVRDVVCCAMRLCNVSVRWCCRYYDMIMVMRCVLACCVCVAFDLCCVCELFVVLLLVIVCV